MRLTDHTDYALRVPMYLAVHDRDLATIREIADRYGISWSHLTKVAHELGCAGFIDTVRGKGGALRLARPADAITVETHGMDDPARRMLSRRLPDRAMLPVLDRSRRGAGGVLRGS